MSNYSTVTDFARFRGWSHIASAAHRDHAVAGGRAEPRRWRSGWRSGPAAGRCRSSTQLTRRRRCAGYHLLPSVRGDLLVQARARFDGGPRRVRARGVDDAQRTRDRAAARPRRRERGTRGGQARRPGRRPRRRETRPSSIPPRPMVPASGDPGHGPGRHPRTGRWFRWGRASPDREPRSRRSWTTCSARCGRRAAASFSYREVARAVEAMPGDTTISASYVHQLRSGVRSNPAMKHVGVAGEGLRRPAGVLLRRRGGAGDRRRAGPGRGDARQRRPPDRDARRRAAARGPADGGGDDRARCAAAGGLPADPLRAARCDAVPDQRAPRPSVPASGSGRWAVRGSWPRATTRRTSRSACRWASGRRRQRPGPRRGPAAAGRSGRPGRSPPPPRTWRARGSAAPRTRRARTPPARRRSRRRPRPGCRCRCRRQPHARGLRPASSPSRRAVKLLAEPRAEALPVRLSAGHAQVHDVTSASTTSGDIDPRRAEPGAVLDGVDAGRDRRRDSRRCRARAPPPAGRSRAPPRRSRAARPR